MCPSRFAGMALASFGEPSCGILTAYPWSKGAKIRPVLDVFCSVGAVELSPGFQPWEPTTRNEAPRRVRQIERNNKADTGPNGSTSQLYPPILAQQICAKFIC